MVVLSGVNEILDYALYSVGLGLDDLGCELSGGDPSLRGGQVPGHPSH